MVTYSSVFPALAEKSCFGFITSGAVVVTPKNIDELENIAEAVYNLSIGSLGCSAIVKNRFIQALESINTKYPNFIFKIEYGELKHPNCGSITSNVAITSNGDLAHTGLRKKEEYVIGTTTYRP